MCIGEVFDYKYFEQQKIRNEVHAVEYACSPHPADNAKTIEMALQMGTPCR